MTPWKNPELLPPAPALDVWSWLEGNESRPVTLEQLRERIAMSGGRTLWNGRSEIADVVLVARPASTRYVPATECRELAEALVARDEARLRKSRNLNAVLLAAPGLFIALSVALANRVPWLFVMLGTIQISGMFQAEFARRRLLAAPDRYLAEQAARTRYGIWLMTTRNRRVSATLAMVVAWTILLAMTFLRSGVSSNDQVLSVALVKSAIIAEPWRLITATLMHGSILHLFFNAGTMLSLGGLMERGVSRSLVAPVWLVAALVGSLASWLLLPAPSVGASGGIMGVFAFLLVMAWRRKSELPPGFYQSLLLSLGMIVMMGIFAWEIIDNAAHAGGAAAGALIGWWVFRADEGELPLPDSRGLVVLNWIAFAIIGAVALFMAAKLFASPMF